MKLLAHFLIPTLLLTAACQKTDSRFVLQEEQEQPVLFGPGNENRASAIVNGQKTEVKVEVEQLSDGKFNLYLSSPEYPGYLMGITNLPAERGAFFPDATSNDPNVLSFFCFWHLFDDGVACAYLPVDGKAVVVHIDRINQAGHQIEGRFTAQLIKEQGAPQVADQAPDFLTVEGGTFIATFDRLPSE